MQWNLVDSNFEMVSHFAQRIKLRKSCKNIMLSNPDQIKNIYKFDKLDSGIVTISVSDEYGDPRFPELKIYINNQNKPVTLDFESDQKILVVLNPKQNITAKRLVISPLKVVITYKA